MRYVIMAVVTGWILLFIFMTDLAIVSAISGVTMLIVNILYHRWEDKHRYDEL